MQKMTQKFDWQSEDEESWGESDINDGEQIKTATSWRRVLAVLIVPLVLVGAILTIRQIEGYTSNAELMVEEDILSSHELVQIAVATADRELLTSVLSGRDPAWTQTQLSLLSEGQFLDRESFGLFWQSQASPSGLQVTLSPDFRHAVVTTTHQYVIGDVGDKSQTISLDHTSVYRRSEDRWLMAPPFDHYWGEPITANGQFLSLTFPSRDQEIGQRLAADLEALLVSICSTLEGIKCNADSHLFVNLDTDPQSIIDMAKAETRLKDTQDINLPAPTLVGTPNDDTAYRAIYLGYAERVVSAFIGHETRWQCCDHILFYQALLDIQLIRLGFRSWPSTEDQYRQLLNGDRTLSGTLWSNDATASEILAQPDAWKANILVEYIVSDWAEVPPFEMQQRLTRFEFFPEWLGSVAREGVENYFAAGWIPFLERRVVESHNRTEPPRLE